MDVINISARDNVFMLCVFVLHARGDALFIISA